MKKILLIAITLLFFTSCSSDDSSEEIDRELILKNYTLSYSTGKIVQHNFEGSKGINTTRNDAQITKIEYNTEGRMSKYIKYSNNGDITESYTFNYDSSGKMTSINEFNTSNLAIPERFTREITYDNNSIKSTFPKNSENNYNIEFLLNTDGLIEKYIQSEPDGQLVTKLIFDYDSNKNCTSAIVTIKDFNNNPITNTFTYNYDDKKNPLHLHFRENYLPSLFIYGRSFLFNIQLREVIRTFGKNNIKSTIYPSYIPEAYHFYFEHDYNNAGYPEKSRLINKSTHTVSYESEFTYE